LIFLLAYWKEHPLPHPSRLLPPLPPPSAILTIPQILKKKKWIDAMEEMMCIVDATDINGLRKKINTCVPPVIPYLGLYLTSLVQIDEGNPNFLGAGKLINYHKCQLIGQTITGLQKYQQQGYDFIPVPALQVFFF
jgi:hypothetical protein